MIIYIPALNEEASITQVIKSFPQMLSQVGEIEILVVDDGSSDQTASLARELGATVISHHKNHGLGIAFQTAVAYVLKNNADLMVSIDADGQFNSADILGLIEPILIGTAQMVTGNRFSDGMPKNMPRIKYWGNKQISRLISMISKHHFEDVSCGFRAYSRHALYHLNLFGRYSYTHEVILNLSFKGLPIMEYPVEVQYFQGRESRIASSIFKYGYNMGKIIFRTLLDYRPMFIFGYIGLACLLTALLFVGFMLINYFITGAFTPYKAFGFIGLGFGIFGLLILFIGLVADMLNRIRLNQDKILYELKNNKQ